MPQFRISEKGFASILITVIILVGIAIATYLTLHSQIFRSHAGLDVTRVEFIDANGNVINQTSSRNVTMMLTYVAPTIPTVPQSSGNTNTGTVTIPGTTSTSHSSSVVTSGDGNVNVQFQGPVASAGGSTGSSSSSNQSFTQTTTTVTSNGQTTTTTTTSGAPFPTGSGSPIDQFPTEFRVANSLAQLPTAEATAFNQNGQHVNWLLTEGDGVKTVYVQFKVGGVWGETVTGTIELSSVIPTPQPNTGAGSVTATAGSVSAFILQSGAPITVTTGGNGSSQTTQSVPQPTPVVSGGTVVNGVPQGGKITLSNGTVIQGGSGGNPATNGTITTPVPVAQPQGGTQSVQQQTVTEVPVKLLVQSDTAANLFNAKLIFDPSRFQVDRIDTAGSFISNWVTNNFDNSAGTITLIGGVPDPGFKTSGATALMATIYLKSLSGGAVVISIDPTSAIFSNSNNTNVLNTPGNPTSGGSNNGGVVTPPIVVIPQPSVTPIATTLPLPTGSSQPTANPTCLPRPACLDATPRCLPPEPVGGWCPPSSPTPSSTTVAFSGGDGNTGNSPGNSSTDSSNTNCVINQTNFSSNQASAGSVVTVTATGNSSCNGQTVTFGVNQDNGLLGSKQIDNPPPPATFTSDGTGTPTATSTWVTQSNNGTLGGLFGSSGYQLTASLGNGGGGGQTVTSSQELKVDKSLSNGSYQKGDVNHDGSITLEDLSAFLTNFGKKSGIPEMDMNGDGVINTFDFSALVQLLFQQNVIPHS